MHLAIQNFVTFPKYQKQKFWKNFNSHFFIKKREKKFKFKLMYTEGSKKHHFLKFLLDCTVLSDVILLRQKFGWVVHDSLSASPSTSTGLSY